MTSTEETHLDALEESMGITFKDREGVLTAFRGLSSCEGEEEENGMQEEKGKGSVAIILGGKK